MDFSLCKRLSKDLEGVYTTDAALFHLMYYILVATLSTDDEVLEHLRLLARFICFVGIILGLLYSMMKRIAPIRSHRNYKILAPLIVDHNAQDKTERLQFILHGHIEVIKL